LVGGQKILRSAAFPTGGVAWLYASYQGTNRIPTDTLGAQAPRTIGPAKLMLNLHSREAYLAEVGEQSP